MIDKIVNEIIIASVIMKTNNLSAIAEQLGYQPILILNALFQGERDGKLLYIKKRDLIKIHEDVEVEKLAITEDLIASRDQIELFIANENGIEVDLAFEELRGFIPMLPELHLKIALYTSDKLAHYEIADPKDKESVYTFYTLKENADKYWGQKQFDAKKSLPSKVAKKAQRKAAAESRNKK